MTLTDLLTMLKTQLTTSEKQEDIKKLRRVKDIQTSIGYLARALGKERPEQCQQEDFLLDESVWKKKLETYYESLDKAPGAITRRNTRNNLRFLFDTASKMGLITAPQPLPLLYSTREEQLRITRQTSPYRDRLLAANKTFYILPQHAWPIDIQAAWQNYAVSRQLKTRQTTLKNHVVLLGAYLGFLINIEGLSIQWDDLFDISFLDRFIRWHSQKQQTHITARAHMLAKALRTLSSHLNHPSLPALKHYLRDLPTPESLHQKQHHWITLRELEAIGNAALQDARKPIVNARKEDALTNPTYLKFTTRPGLIRALQHQHALMIRLLVRIPLRSRNLREIQLDKNLYQDQHDHWHLHFSGSELKVGTRNGRTNEYHINLTEYFSDLLPHLEEFLKVYRPRIPNTDTSPLLFRTRDGNPFTGHAIHDELAALVLRRSDKRFYPHLIRIIWATEFLTNNPGEYGFAATMLGDTVQMVLKRYYELEEKQAHAKASQFLTAALR